MKFEEGFIFQIVRTMREEAPSRFLAPPANVYETENEWIIELIMPGIEKDSLKVVLEDEILKVEAKKRKK
ncbi:MAG: Hsp20/alpha crystallin family protein [candidate division WOR-3 bacterium]